MNIADAINKLRPDLQIRDDLIIALTQLPHNCTYFATIPRDIFGIISDMIPRTRIIDLQPIVDKALQIYENFVPPQGKYCIKIINDQFVCAPYDHIYRWLYVGGPYLFVNSDSIESIMCEYPDGKFINPPDNIKSDRSLWMGDAFDYVEINGDKNDIRPYVVLPCGLTVVEQHAATYLVDFVTGQYEKLNHTITGFVNDAGDMCYTPHNEAIKLMCKLDSNFAIIQHKKE